ncbi:putative pentatricopeptide repeat-containing protein [Trifolium repens]|nr:putative pentatricopeptide repeat-containing protein [Trifolium repens]
MLNSPIGPNHFIYHRVLKSSKERVLIGSVHSQIVKTGFLEYPVVQTSLVDSYSKVLGGFRDAQKVFDEMSERNVLCFTALVFLRAGDVECGLKVFDEMVERECRLGLRLLVVVLRMVFFSSFSEGIRLFREMVFVAAAGFCSIFSEFELLGLAVISSSLEVFSLKIRGFEVIKMSAHVPILPPNLFSRFTLLSICVISGAGSWSSELHFCVALGHDLFCFCCCSRSIPLAVFHASA